MRLGEVKMWERVEEHEGKRVRELERFREMVVDLAKYNWDGSEDVLDLEEAALMGLMGRYRKGKEGRLHGIAIERYAVFWN